MSKHSTQRNRVQQISWIENEMTRLGGYLDIQQTIGLRNWCFYIARELGCTFQKAKEYMDLVMNSRQAIRKVEEQEAVIKARRRQKELEGKNVKEKKEQI